MKNLLLPFTIACLLSACAGSNVPVVEENAPSSSSSDSAAASSASQEIDLEQGGSHVSGVVPSELGMVAHAETDEFGRITTGVYEGGFLSTQAIDRFMVASSVVLEQYPYRIAEKDTIVPSISLLVYPAMFSDDPESDYQAMTAAEKQKVLDPLIQIYNQRGLGSLPLEQADVHVTPVYRGGIWGNTGFRSDRMAVQYIENAAGDLRGVAFFANEGQDYGFFAVYKAVLVNPAKRLLITAYFPLSHLQELQPFTDVPATAGEQDIIDLQMRGYEYLKDPAHYKATALGAVMKDIQRLMESLELR